MKKCPSCQKTYEDNMKFCQSDGTPLVVVAEETPSDDPYKTMVASDIKLPLEEPNVPDAPKAAPEAVEPAAPEPVQPKVAEVTAPDDDDEDVLEIPEKREDVDPMKTVVVSGTDTSDNIKIPDLPVADPEPPPPVDPKPAAPLESKPAAPVEPKPAEPPKPAADAAPPMDSPEIPKFSEPDVKPPDLGASEDPSDFSGEQKTPAPQGKESGERESKPSLPIPSPFEESMPPGVAFPEKPPFEEKAKPPEPKPAASGPATPPASPFADPEAPVDTSSTEDWGVPSAASNLPVAPAAPDPFGNNSILSTPDPPADGAEGENKTLAIVSLVTGILSCLCCFSIITGPVALVTGYMARGKINEDPGTYGGGTLAMIGMLLGVVGIFLFLILIVLQFMGGLAQLL